MKKPAFLFILLAISFISLSQSKLDILHYRFQIAVTDQSDSIYGVAFIQFKLLENSAAMDFDFTARHGKGMQIIKLQFSNSKSGKVNYTHAKEKLSIRNAIYKKNDTATVIIHYKGIPSGGFIIARNKFGQRTFFADNWPNRAHHWLPCNDDPSDKAPVEFLVTAPDHYRVVSNGMQLEETILNNGYKLTHWREEIPIATKVLALGIADFAVEITGYANSTIPVYSWAFPADAEKAVHDFSLTKEILEYYIRTIGPYGYKKLANVQSKTMFGGLENANAISYSENRIHGDGSNEALLAHEVAHQWFGNMATEKSFGHLWLSEGFATYFTILYLENKYGKDTLSLIHI